MKHQGLKQGLNTLNLLLVATFLVLALYSAVGQQILPYIGKYRLDVEGYLSQLLESRVRIRKLSGDMKVLTPSVHIEGITMHGQISLSNQQKDPAILSIAAVDAILDPRRSLLNLTPVFKSVRLSGISLRLDRDALTSQQSVDSQVSINSVQRFVETLLLQQHLELNNVSVQTWLNGQQQTLQIDHMVMTGDGFNRLMTGSLSYGDDNKVKAAVRIFSQGSPYNLDDFYARGVIDLPNLDVDYWLQQLTEVSVFNEFNATAQLGFEFKDSLLNYAKLNLATPTLSIPNQAEFNNINTQLWLRQENPDTWNLWLNEGRFTFNDKKWQLEDVALKLSKTPNGNRWHSFIKKIELAYLHSFVSEFDLIPESLKPLLVNINARGEINDFSLVLQNNANEKIDVTIAAELSGVSTDAYDSIPGVTNVSGVLAATQHSGRVQFSSDNMKLDFPDLYHDAFEILQGSGQVDWMISDTQTRIVGDGLSMALSDVEVIKGGFQLWLPNNTELDSTLALNLSFDNASVTVQNKLVPKLVSKDLREWLDSSLESGQVKDGHFYFYSSLPEGQPLSQLELYFDMDDVSLRYLPNWPKVEHANGQLFVINTDVAANLSSAQTLGGGIKNGQIVYQIDKNELGFLWVDAFTQGAAADMFSYFQQTPLQQVVGGVMDEWQLLGRHETQLGFKIPLDSPIGSMAIDIKTQLNNSELQLTDVGLNFSKLTGTVQYLSHNGLSGTGIAASLWGQPFKADIKSQFYDEHLKTDIGFQGTLDSIGLKDWLQLGLLNSVSGKAIVDGHFIIDGRENSFSGLKVNSQLQGIKLDLPEPLLKPSQDKAQFETQLQINDGLTLKLSYDEKVNLAMNFKDDKFKSGQVFLGATEAYVPSSPGLVVQGHISEINVNDWQEVWLGIEALDKQYNLPSNNNNPNNSEGKPLRKIIISTDKIVYDDFLFEYIKSEINVKENLWNIQLDSPLAKGNILYEKDKETVIELDYLHWPMLADSPSSEDTDPLLNVDPSEFPKLNLSIDEIFLGPTNYGQWKVRVEPNEKGVVLSGIRGEIKKLNVEGEARWVKNSISSDTQKSHLKLKLSSKDLGGIQKAWPIGHSATGRAHSVRANGSITKLEWGKRGAGYELRDPRLRILEFGFWIDSA